MAETNLNIEILKKEIATLVEEYSKDENVECIYLLPLVDDGKIYLYMFIVFLDCIEFEKKMNELTELTEKYDNRVDEIGGRFIVDAIRNHYFRENAENMLELESVKDLFSSSILFDRNGKYYKIAHQFDQYYHYMEKYRNVLDVNLDELTSNTRERRK